jgi:hypothetical protein
MTDMRNKMGVTWLQLNESLKRLNLCVERNHNLGGRFLRGHINLCSGCSDKLLTKVVFLARLLPFISFDIVSYGTGLTKMSLKKFILATFLGMLPLTFVYNYSGAVLLAGGGLSLMLGLVIVFLLFLFPIWIEQYDLFSLGRFFRHDEG